MAPKPTPNRPEIDQKSGLKSKLFLATFLHRFWADFGAFLGSLLGSLGRLSGSQVGFDGGPESDFDGSCSSEPILLSFWSDLGSILGRFWVDLASLRGVFY